MPDQFSRLYHLLSADEQKKCNAFFAAQAGEKEKALYTELRKGKQLSTQKLAVKIYGDDSKVANVRQLRKQVTDKLEALISERLFTHGEGLSRIRRRLDFADFLIERHATDLALEYLLEAENEANEARAYDLLESIYQYKLTHSATLSLDPKHTYDDWKKNKEKYANYMYLLSAEAILTALLSQLRPVGEVPNQKELMTAFYDGFKPSEEERRNPGFMYRLARMFRKVMLSTKDYWRIEPTVLEIYQYLVDHNSFTPNDNGIVRGFLLMLAQAGYRNRNFEVAEERLFEVQRLLPVPISRNDPDYAKMLSQRAAIYTYTDRCEQAVDLLRKHLYGPEPVSIESERANMQLNLAVNYFCLREHTRALEQINKLDHTDKEYSENLGHEWVYKKLMIHVILLWEAGQYEQAEVLLQNMMDKFRDFLDQELYKRAWVFMEFIQRWFRDSSLITNPAFHREVRDASLGWGENEDIHAIFFFSWFRAHMLEKPFYPTFQARLKEEGRDWDYPFSLKG